MKILLVADFYPPDPGGLEAHVKRLARALAQHGHDVLVAAGGGAEEDAAIPPQGRDRVRVARLPLAIGRLPLAAQAGHVYHPPWADRAFTRRLAHLADAWQPEVVHAHGWSEFSAVEAVGSVPLVVTLHDYGLCCPKKTLLRAGRECERGRGARCVTCSGESQGVVKRAGLAAALAVTSVRVRRGARRYLAVSNHVAERHVAGGLDPALLQVVPNFLDLPERAPPVPEGPARVLYVGPDSAHKGRGVLLEAWELLDRSDERVRDARLVLVGAGADPGLARVELAGRLKGDALWRRYREASVVVVPSIWPEPCATVALEAMGWGRAVVASRTGGLGDLVADGVSGTLVPPGDAEALAGALRTLLAEPGRAAGMGDAARARAHAFSAAAVVPRIEAVYREVVGSATVRVVS
jgi:glycosyltransferase involved in cell wall biosynthesis